MEDEFDTPEQKPTTKMALLPRKDDDLPIDVGLRNLTKALFYEFRHQSSCSITPPYCLKDYDYEYNGVVYRSMYMIYMECDSEYEAAIKLLGSYSHWEKLKACNWFKPHLEKWEEERNTRDEAMARSVLVALAEAGNVTAARTIFTNSKNGSKRGRPSKGGKRKPQLPDDVIGGMLGRLDEK